MLANAEFGARAVLEEGVDQEDCQGDGLVGGEVELNDEIYEGEGMANDSIQMNAVLR